MDDLVIMYNQQPVTTSLKVAEVFGKNHINVMRNIECLLKNEQSKQMFVKSTYVNQQSHQEWPIYFINRDGFTLLAKGFTDQKVMQFKLKFIEAFNSMECQILIYRDSNMIVDPIDDKNVY